MRFIRRLLDEMPERRCRLLLAMALAAAVSGQGWRLRFDRSVARRQLRFGFPLDGAQRGHAASNALYPTRDGWITLIYRDDGRGIPPEHRDKVFDPFFTTKRGTGGSGLGMHIVYNLVTQMLGGTIQLNSKAAQGVEFVIRFPSAVQKEAA